MIRHLIVEPNAAPRPWDPAHPGPELPRDCPYFGKALVEMEKHLDGTDLHCYLTWNNDSLPEYGPHVVAILIGEEWGMIPRYARHVRLVARVMSHYPFLGIRRWFPITWLKVLLTVKHARNWERHLRSWLRFQFPPRSWPAPVHSKANIVHLPWGSAALTDVPMRPMRQRSRSYYFSGGILLGSDFGYRRYLGAPKILARESLVQAVKQIEQKHPELALAQSVMVHAEKATNTLTNIDDYSEKLMNTRVCLAPRGSVADTWRFFEGLKSGCAVITNPLPNEWYYRDAPAIQLDDWDELEDVLLPLLADEDRLEAMQEQALWYWENVCGEKALGRFLAQAIRVSFSEGTGAEG